MPPDAKARTSLRPAFALLAAIALTVVADDASAQACPGGVCPPVVVTAPRTTPTLPTIQRRAPTTSGRTVMCWGESCADLIRSMQRESLMEHLAETGEITNEDDIAIEKATFCKRMKDTRPASCGASMPQVPMFSVNYRGNGCGPSTWGGRTRDFVAAMIQYNVGNFSGDLDAPFPGVSFRGACDAHDACYAISGSNREVCDGDFGEDMRRSCSENLSGAPFAACANISAAYQHAVSSLGSSAFNAGQNEAACARWHFEMEANQCPKQ